MTSQRGKRPRPRVGKFGHLYNIGPRISKKVKNVKKYGPKGVPDPRNINDVNAMVSFLTLNIKYDKRLYFHLVKTKKVAQCKWSLAHAFS